MTDSTSPAETLRAQLAERLAREAEQRQEERQRRLASPDDYRYDKSQGKFWDILDNTLHDDKQVDASIPRSRWRVVVTAGGPAEGNGRGRPRSQRETLVEPSKDIQRVENGQFVEGSTWWPGKPQTVEDWFIDANGAYPAPGRRIFNQYRPPPRYEGVVAEATPWVEHVRRLWPEEGEHEYFFDYCAHMVQRPHEKCNAGIVLAGTQGIGKDAALLPVKAAVGVWNSKEIDPDDLFSPYRPWLQTLMLTINEVRPSKDEHHASSMYNTLKPLIAAPPEVLPLNDKYKALRYIINVLRVFMTTNEPHAMFIPEEDRRMFVMRSFLPQRWHVAAGQPEYFRKLFAWMRNGGFGHVAAWLWARDLSRFDPSGPPPKTAAWDAVAGSWTQTSVVGQALAKVPDDYDDEGRVKTKVEAAPGSKLAEDGQPLEKQKVDCRGNPEVLFPAELVYTLFDERDAVQHLIMKQPRALLKQMEELGYTAFRRPPTAGEKSPPWRLSTSDGEFKAATAYVRKDLMSQRNEIEPKIAERMRKLIKRSKLPSAPPRSV